MIDRFERFSLNISEISRYWHKIAAEEMEKYNLKGPHSIYLVAIHRYKEGITASQLCELCGKDKADVSRMISILEEKGLVEKEGANYRGLIKLTSEGKYAATQVCQRASKAVEVAGKGIADQDRETFYNVLELIASNLKKISKEGLPKDESN